MFVDIVEGNVSEFESMAVKLGIKAIVVYSEKTHENLQGSKIRSFTAGSKKSQLLTSRSLMKDLKILLTSANAPMKHSDYKSLSAKKIAICFPLSEILHEKEKPHYLENLVRHIKLCRKHQVVIVIATLAKDAYSLRAERELAALYHSLGMTTVQLKEGLSITGTLLGIKESSL
jgi:hypothetical protein